MRYAIVCLLALLAQVSSAQDKPRALSEGQWNDDLSWLVNAIETIHPQPFSKTSKVHFEAKADSLKHGIPNLNANQITAGMMQLVASLHDGHSHLDPASLNRWFPVRFYSFSDGLFITAIEQRHKDCVGCKVVKIGALDAKDALALAGSLKGSDNQFGELENGVLYLSNADLLQALGVIDSDAALSLQLQPPDGSMLSIVLTSQAVEKQTNWMQWGEMYGAVPNLTTFFAGRVSSDFRKGDKGLPLYLRMRLPYWFEYLSETKTLYFQFNFVERKWNGGSFQQFQKKLFAFIDSTDVGKFVIDIRYNSGGDGSILDAFLHEIIKRDKINQKGKLFVLVGRKTFSAAVMLLGSLKRHTNAYFVGEPAGAPLNHCGEAQTYNLPNSGFELELSTLYYQIGGPADSSRYFPIDFPFQFSSREYFIGADSALEFIIHNNPITLCDVLRQGGNDAATLYEQRVGLKSRYPWYTPFLEEEMNRTGYDLLEEAKTKDAIEAFVLNTKAYPASWNTWDSLAEAYMDAGSDSLALQNYQKALELNPGDESAKENVRKIKHLK